MPIRINLKELFASDPQEIAIDKINFNFNKLLELGVGEEGDPGPSGPQGPAGPIGLTGNPGIRGSSWFVGSGDPNSNTFLDLLDGDFYLDSSNNSIWQYDLDTNSWSLIVDLGLIVNNYLVSAGSPFVRGFGINSPDDQRFIVFSNRGNNLSDIFLDSTLGNQSNNDILFLNNFNEKIKNISNFPLSTNDEFNAIEKIYVDHSSSTLGRYHLELGFLYSDSPNVYKLSKLKENYKIRFLRDNIINSQFSNTNSYVNILRNSLSVSELVSLNEINFNALYEWICPKFNNEGPTPIKKNFIARLGSNEAIKEYNSYIQVDGISFNLDLYSVAFGLANEFNTGVSGSLLNGLNFLMIDHSLNVSGIFLNKKVYQNNGDIEQLAYSIPEETSYTNSPNAPVITKYGRIGAASFGNKLFSVVTNGELVTSFNNQGSFFLFSLEDPKQPKLLKNVTTDGNVFNFGPISTSCDNGNNIFGPGAADVELLGDFAYIVNNLSQYSGPSDTPTTKKVAFQIVKLDHNLGQFNRVSQIFNSDYPEAMEAVNKIKLYNNYAITISKNYETSVLGTGNAFNIGSLNAIDISDVSRPYLVTNIESDRTNYLALEIIDDYAITLTFEQGTFNMPNVSYVKIYVDVFDLKGLNRNPYNNQLGGPNLQTIDLLLSTRNTSSAFVNQSSVSSSAYNSNYSIQKQIGAITGNKQKFFVGYRNQIKVFNLYANTCYNIMSGKPNFFNLNQDTNFLITNDNNYYISDIKLIANDLYVLASNTTNSTKLFKFDVTDIYNPIKIYEKDLTDEADSSSRFIIIGKMIYLITSNGNNQPVLISIETDGIKSPSANIGSLRTDTIKVLKDADIAQNLRVHNNIIVGRGGIYSNRINTNQIYGNVSLINSKVSAIQVDSLSFNNQFTVNGTISNDFSKYELSFKSILNNVTISVQIFRFRILPAPYDRIIMWNSVGDEGNTSFVKNSHSSNMYMEYGYGSVTSPNIYKIEKFTDTISGGEFIIPANVSPIIRLISSNMLFYSNTVFITFVSNRLGLGSYT